ncbi:glycosyltransferase [Paenibacillus prosopidis]|uniref:Glycosyltransferase involved in cell wall biosynthesis n=1 Tax=Paenibacillus prosopidis TaxID=630520 RepID=A0A368VZM9_9BACL|nr:glycosyltransferase [Paenibacillus prosopidis]RCW47879.1 glycosyltransferase involved in cell wall biosynthesis [Paenibacillus prosopidis]
MKVLYVTTRPPYPPHRGDQLIAYEQIRNLPKGKYELYLVSLVRNENEKKEALNQLQPYCKKIIFVRLGKIGSILGLIKTLFNWKPLQVNMYSNKGIRKQMTEIYDMITPDIVHIQTVRLGELLRKKNTSKVMDMIDILSLNMERRALKENIILKGILKLEAVLLKKYEKKMTNDYQVVSLVSQNDLIHSHLKYANTIINPNGTYINNEYIEKYNNIVKEDIVIFHGNMSYFPNVEAMVYFVNEIWPDISRQFPKYKLYIVGKDPVDKILRLSAVKNVHVTGFVDDICELLLKAKIGIYPLRSGTGMQNKILEALACGLPTIASNFALQGVPDVTSEEVIRANEKEEYIKAIELLINDENIREKYKENGQGFVFSNYSWESNVETLMSMWERALKT